MELILTLLILVALILSFIKTTIKLYAIICIGLIAGIYLLAGMHNNGHRDRVMDSIRLTALCIAYAVYLVAMLIFSWGLYMLRRSTDARQVLWGVVLSLLVFITALVIFSVLH